MAKRRAADHIAGSFPNATTKRMCQDFHPPRAATLTNRHRSVACALLVSAAVLAACDDFDPAPVDFGQADIVTLGDVQTIDVQGRTFTSLPESPPAVDPDQAALGRDLLMRGDNFSSLEIEAEVVTRLQGIAEYTTAFEAAFGGGAITIERVAQALAAFQRTLVANNSPFDRWMRGEAGALSNRELSGMAEFARSGCADCHSGPLFSDHQLRVLGVREGQGLTEPDSGGSDFAFRTPSLRQLDFTGPYFHAGQFASLGQAVDFYDERRSSENPNVPSTALDPEVLEVPGMEDGRGAILADFLRALNDPGFDQSEPEAVPSGLSPGGFSLQ